MNWSLKWTENLDTEVYEPYPLQFANVERIECNDAVYMFDETGCGKTISSGLMDNFVPAVLQTLFLFVQVVSTTFASVGNFLRDVKKRSVIGTLVVDEAGQAQPQMAVGALYRSRKAIIVGDPRQVEPVVTDD